MCNLGSWGFSIISNSIGGGIGGIKISNAGLIQPAQFNLQSIGVSGKESYSTLTGAVLRAAMVVAMTAVLGSLATFISIRLGWVRRFSWRVAILSAFAAGLVVFGFYLLWGA